MLSRSHFIFINSVNCFLAAKTGLFCFFPCRVFLIYFCLSHAHLSLRHVFLISREFSVNGIWDKSGGYKTSRGTLNNPVLIYISTPDNHLGDTNDLFNQIDYQSLLAEAAISELPLPQTTVPPPLELNPTHINFLVRFFRSFSAIPAIFRPRRLRCHISPTVALFDDLNCFMSLKKRIKT